MIAYILALGTEAEGDFTHSFRVVGMVDNFNSFIWTERFYECGDFELSVAYTQPISALVREGRFISIGKEMPGGYSTTKTKTVTVARIDKVEIIDDADEGFMIKASGETLLTILKERRLGSSMTVGGSDLDVDDYNAYNLQRLVALRAIGPSPTLSAKDAIPGLVVEELGTPPTTVSDFSFEPSTSYEVISDIASTYNIGISLGLSASVSTTEDCWDLYNVPRYRIYIPRDRTTNQTVFPPVVFDREYDTLNHSNEVRSVTDYRNIAIVYGKSKVLKTPNKFVTEPFGFYRRIIGVSATDISGTTAKAKNKLANRGNVQLSKSKKSYAVDGEIPNPSKFQYDKDYFMGDIVELRSPTGTIGSMRVVEFIRVHDKEGERSYPTLIEASPPNASTGWWEPEPDDPEEPVV